MDFVLDREAFIYALACSPRFLFGGLLGMVYEFWNCFVLDEFVSGFDFFFEICGHIAHGHVPPILSCLFIASRLLVLEK